MKKQEFGYKGYGNYETWLVAWWLSTDNFASAFCREATIRSRVRSQKCGVKETAQSLLAWDIQTEVENRSPQEESLFTDLLGAALRNVNWDEVANSFLNELKTGNES